MVDDIRLTDDLKSTIAHRPFSSALKQDRCAAWLANKELRKEFSNFKRITKDNKVSREVI